ncbi:MAG: hypothetical protein KDA21_11690 [Phycisphaerales bacterium]|nr:hypothetical protein [Phycisphaerales bacterium]
MQRHTRSGFVVSATLMSAAAASAGPGDYRFWIGGIAGMWNDASKWSLTEGGPGGAGAPLEGEEAYLFNNNHNAAMIVLYAAPANPGVLDNVSIRGIDFGPTGAVDLFLSSGDNLHTRRLLVQDHVDIEHSDGRLDVDFSCEFEHATTASAGVRYRISGDGLLNTSSLIVGPDHEPWCFIQDGGGVYATAMTFRGTPIVGQPLMLQINAGEMETMSLFLEQGATMEMNGGTFTASSNFWVGNSSLGGDARLIQNEGELTAHSLLIGTALSDVGSTAEFHGGQTICDTLQVVGNAPMDPSILLLDGGDISTDTLALLLEARLEIADGTLETIDMTADALPLIEITGGALVSTGLATINAAMSIDGGAADFDTLDGQGTCTMGPGAQLVLRQSGRLRRLTMSGGRVHGGFTGSPVNPYLLGNLTLGELLTYSGGSFTTHLHIDSFDPNPISLQADLIIAGDLTIESATTGDPSHVLTARSWDLLNTYALAGGDINATLNQVTIETPGALRGPGSVNASITSHGLIDIAGTAFDAPLEVLGGLTSSPEATMLFTITRDEGITHAPPVTFTGPAHVDGLLRVSVSGQYRPTIGDRLTLLTSPDVTGLFDLVSFDLSGTVPYDLMPVYSRTAIELEVVAPICFGDTNGDDQVNFADLELLLEGWGMTVTPGTQGDITGNGVVDFADLNILLDHWGDVCF